MADIQTQLPVKGSLTNNSAAPIANNVGALVVLANAATPSWTEGNQVLLSTDLSGSLRVSTGTAVGNVNITQVGGLAITLGSTTAANSFPVTIATDNTLTVQGTKTNNAAAPGTNNLGALVALANASDPSWTEGNEVLLSSNNSGYLRVTTGTANSNINLAQVGGASISLGQTTMANSIPVTFASNQSALNVVFGEVSTGVVAEYVTESSVASGSTSTTLTYTVPAAVTFYLKQIIASSSGGPCRVQVDYGAGPTIVVVGFYSTTSPNYIVEFAQPIAIATGTTVRIKTQNNAGSAQDLYGFFGGIILP